MNYQQYDNEFKGKETEYNISLMVGEEFGAKITVASYEESIAQAMGWVNFGVEKYNNETHRAIVEPMNKKCGAGTVTYYYVGGFIAVSYPPVNPSEKNKKKKK